MELMLKIFSLFFSMDLKLTRFSEGYVKSRKHVLNPLGIRPRLTK